MANALPRLFASRRRHLGLTLGQVARRAGYRNASKGANHLSSIERGDEVFPDRRILDRFVRALDLDDADVDQALCEDFERLDRPVPPEIVQRVMPAVYMRVPLPDGASAADAVEIAAVHAEATGRSVWVRLSAIRGVFIGPGGDRSESYGTPASDLRGLPGAVATWMRRKSAGPMDVPRESRGFLSGPAR